MNQLDDIEAPVTKVSKLTDWRHNRRAVKNLTEYLTPPEIWIRYFEHFKELPYLRSSKRLHLRDRALVAAYYVSGLRKRELLNLTLNQVYVEPDFIELRNIQIEKQKKTKQAKIITKGLPRKGAMAPFTQVILEYLETLKRKAKTSRLFPIKDIRAYQIVRDTTGMWPHYFRAQNISWLVNDCQLNTLVVQQLTGHTSVQSIQPYVHNTYKQFSEQLLK